MPFVLGLLDHNGAPHYQPQPNPRPTMHVGNEISLASDTPSQQFLTGPDRRKSLFAWGLRYRHRQDCPRRIRQEQASAGNDHRTKTLAILTENQ